MAQSNRGRIYWPKCGVCQYEKRNPTIKQQLLDSTYFNPLGTESLMSVWHRWGDPFNTATIYTHMRRHRTKQTQEIDLAAPTEAVPLVDMPGEVTAVASSAHERGLDEIIVKGREMIRSGELKITTQALLTAIKTKSEIEKSNKDRNLDAMALMASAFSGTAIASPDSISDPEG